MFEVLHLETQRRRALKVMHASLCQSEELRERFRREATVAAHVDSEFIVDVFDAGVDEATGMPFLVMELLRGEELGQKLKRVGRLEPDEVLSHLHYVALALDKTHQASIIHRDLKPANVFLSEREEGGVRVKVLDFGIAKIVAEGTATGGATQSLGTPLYMAPEQFNPRSKLTNGVDIYALGMMAYTLLVGVPYWFEEARGGNVYAVVALAIHGIAEPASVRAAAQGVRLLPTFDAWFARATALDPKHRFPTASAAVQELAIAFGKSVPARTSLPSMATEVPYSAPQQAITPPPHFATPASPMPMMTPHGAARMGQAPDLTSMAAATTLAKPAKSIPPWMFVAGGCFAVLTLGLGAFLATRENASPVPPNPTPATSALPEAPTNAPTAQNTAQNTAPIVTPVEMNTATPKPTTTAQSTARTTTTTTRVSTPAPPAPTPTATTPRKKSYTRE